MPRPPDEAKRRDLLQRVRAYVRGHGLSELSLRPLARDLGTSDRMLLYYFGTKERMVAEALALDEQRPILRLRQLLDSHDPPRDAAALRRMMERVWQQFHVPGIQAALPLYLEMMAASVLRPERYGPVMRDILTEWTDLTAGLFTGLGLPPARARAEATLLVDSTFGLLLAPLADGDRDRADRAFVLLLDRLEPGWRTPGA
ncbi:TetR/AcrR family transcriptional regulator [Streptomyces avidinii]|uniref:TetR/AcrR family transcriptional regulator n=1 Tax=Streptomyces avidinii TaxID=1895 RepID=UPI003868E19C|nr:TetR/AcrR family transcriptional regulator [Streptomyces avidinii]